VWTYGRGRKPRRPPTDLGIVDLILRLARENPRWGCIRIQGEPRKLGIRVGGATIRTLLRKGGPRSCPQAHGSTWSEFLRAQPKGIIACDFFCVETIRLKTLYVLMFIEPQTRRELVTPQRPTRTRPGSPSRRGTCPWTATAARRLFGS
jgi:putative transposase